MRGQILVFNAEKQTGAVITADGQRFLFPIHEWLDIVPPERGMAVDFTLDADDRASQLRLAPLNPVAIPATHAAAPRPAPPPKRKAALTLWALFLGMLGAHRFYMGAWGWGLVQALGLLVLGGIFSALLPPLAGLLYLAVIALTWVEVIRYIWMSDAQFDAKAKAYQGTQPGPFSFFW